jgi:hypothetical protein
MKELDERVRQAVAELRATILVRYPAATFVLTRSPDDPRSIHLEAIADVDDPDEVGDLVIDRVVEMQAEEGIPIHVIPLQTPERVAAALQSQATRGAPRVRGTRLFDGVTAHLIQKE